MKKDPAGRINEFNDSLALAKKLLEDLLKRSIDLVELQGILTRALDLPSELYLLDLDLSADDIVKILLDHDIESRLGETEVIELGHSIFPAGVLSRLDEERVKHKNQIWLIHKADRDPWPSNPHGDNPETGIKLDLSNGRLFRNRKEVGQLRRKDLDIIRNKMKKIEPPPLKV